MYFVGGRFAPRTLVVAALAITGVADLSLTISPGYTTALLAHIAIAFAGMAPSWSALVKAIGSFGPTEQQGRLFGFLEAIRGVTSTVISGVGALLIGTVLIWFALRGQADEAPAGDRSARSVRQLLAAARNKYTWLLGGSIMLMYCFYTTLGYFSPLLQHNFGVTAGLIGMLGVDKVTHSTPRFLWLAFIGATLYVAVLLFLPGAPAMQWAALTLMFVLSFMVFAGRGGVIGIALTSLTLWVQRREPAERPLPRATALA
jgi:hypothetical protein